jgi:signal transduction histidine kinase
VGHRVGRVTAVVVGGLAARLRHAAVQSRRLSEELRESRARVVASADETRRRIERDLHDGAQQRLVTLALQLRMTRAAVPADRPDLGAELDRVEALGGRLYLDRPPDGGTMPRADLPLTATRPATHSAG